MDPLLKNLTIGMPVYNEGRYLREAVESCIGQAGRIILCDNASNDGSSEICAGFAAKHPEVEHVLRERNIGAFNNFKDPLFACHTDFFCWIGGHDRIGNDYTLHLLKRLADDPEIALAAGTIQHMDEEGRHLGKTVRSGFLESGPATRPLDRVEALARHLRDCFVFHGVYRTPVLREAWHDRPCLGIDRIILFRVSALARTAYVPEALLYARDFPATRKAKEDRKRRSEVLGESKPIAMTNFERNLMLVRTALDLACDDASLSQAFRVIARIRRRHHERRRYRKLHVMLAAGGLLLVLIIILLAIT
jgi:cellulose synthase/poly-beta-1,6-N-acetylglucosamine synthase-like glycosyltransferase